MGEHLRGTLLSVGVDYLTVTASEQTSVDLLRSYAFGLAEVEMSAGFFGSPWSMSGYEGFRVGGVEYGERHDGCCCRLIGVLANGHWRPLYEKAQNCSRIDLQCTVRPNKPARVVLDQHLSDMLRRDATRKAKPQTAYHVCRLGGLTIDSGSRESDRFMRIYDKAIQSGLKQYENSIRYEVEIKGKRAKRTALWLFRMRSEHAAIAQEVRQFASKRGCCLRGLSNAFGAFASIDAPQCPARVSDLENSCRWLRKSVRPTVQSVMNRVGREHALWLLGVADQSAVAFD